MYKITSAVQRSALFTCHHWWAVPDHKERVAVVEVEEEALCVTQKLDPAVAQHGVHLTRCPEDECLVSQTLETHTAMVWRHFEADMAAGQTAGGDLAVCATDVERRTDDHRVSATVRPA